MRFIAEVSSNHQGDLARSLAFVDAAADAGCSAVKFQLFRVRQLFAPEAIRVKPELMQREAWELDIAFLPHIAEKCRARSIEFGCTPFYLEAVSQLVDYVDFFKVASYELLWDDLLAECARTGKPLIVSTGMATIDEVAHAVSVVRAAGCRDLTLLHCVSGYPAPIEECNLSAIETLRDAFGCKVGWSDHSVSPAVIQRAIHHWGAAAIEFHLDLDGSGDEFKTGHCWLPLDIGAVIAETAAGFIADGDGRKVPSEIETLEREWRADPVDGLRPLRTTRALL